MVQADLLGNPQSFQSTELMVTGAVLGTGSDKLVPDVWLSNLLGKPAFQLTGNYASFSLDFFPPGPCFISAKVSATDQEGLEKLQHHGFCLIDTNLQFLRPVAAIDEPVTNLRFAVSDDEIAVRELARCQFRQNRFHRDSQIGPLIASRIKEEWAGNYFTGNRGNWMVVAQLENKVKGFLLLLHDECQNHLIVDLIAVAANHRGKGIASAMIAYAILRCLPSPIPMRVGTQLSNPASIAFYAKLGFKMVSADYVLHCHIN